jgi:hypothetical protein
MFINANSFFSGLKKKGRLKKSQATDRMNHNHFLVDEIAIDLA